MNTDVLALGALVLAAAPCGLFLVNLFLYRRLGPLDSGRGVDSVSVLIPARNEARNIVASLEAVLSTRGVCFEVVVLDDHSTDDTAAVVSAIAARDERLRLSSAPPLPVGWCGKQHACHVLAGLARYPVLVFIDADVRLSSEALPRISAFLRDTGSALVSGVPRQELGSFSERLLRPFIHGLLMGYLPMAAMRRTRKPSLSAGCGQLFAVDAKSYHTCGGHGAIRATLHDGLKLPRSFREAGCRTDLFDATDLASCRMYHTDTETWRGLSKNAIEGLGAPRTLFPMTPILLGGQVLPFLLLAYSSQLSSLAFGCTLAAVICALLPRFLAAFRFHLPLGSAFLHPIGVVALLGIQWRALFRYLLGRSEQWKGRSYPVASTKSRSGVTLLLAGFISFGDGSLTGFSALNPLPASGGGVGVSSLSFVCKSFDLQDQYEVRHSVVFPRTNVMVLTLADRQGSEQVDPWVTAVKGRYAGRLELLGVADVSAAPSFVRGTIRRRFQKARPHPVLMDWEGSVARSLAAKLRQANVYVIGPDGRVMLHTFGSPEPASLERVFQMLDTLLTKSP